MNWLRRLFGGDVVVEEERLMVGDAPGAARRDAAGEEPLTEAERDAYRSEIARAIDQIVRRHGIEQHESDTLVIDVVIAAAVIGAKPGLESELLQTLAAHMLARGDNLIQAKRRTAAPDLVGVEPVGRA